MADEILFQARVHPETPASALSAEEVESLRKAMLDVCNLAVSVGADDERRAWGARSCGCGPGVTQSWYSVAEARSPGDHSSSICRFPRDWLFHTRWHKTGGKVLGHSVRRASVTPPPGDCVLYSGPRNGADCGGNGLSQPVALLFSLAVTSL